MKKTPSVQGYIKKLSLKMSLIAAVTATGFVLATPASAETFTSGISLPGSGLIGHQIAAAKTDSSSKDVEISKTSSSDSNKPDKVKDSASSSINSQDIDTAKDSDDAAVEEVVPTVKVSAAPIYYHAHGVSTVSARSNEYTNRSDAQDHWDGCSPNYISESEMHAGNRDHNYYAEQEYGYKWVNKGDGGRNIPAEYWEYSGPPPQPSSAGNCIEETKRLYDPYRGQQRDLRAGASVSFQGIN